MISLKQIKYFVEIVEAGSYSRASERLYIAQSALSRQMKELESEVQAVLMERDSRHLELTDAGRLLYERSKRILEEIAETVQQVQQVGKGEQGTIRLLHSSSVTLTAELGKVLNTLLAEFPGVSLDVSKASSDHQAMDIEEGRADLGMIRFPILRNYPNIVVKEFFTEKLMVAVSEQHALAGKQSTDIASLREEYFVSIPHKDRGGLSYLVTSLCLKQGFFPKVARAISRKTSLLNLVEANMGIAIVPDSMQEVAPKGVRFIALSDQESSSVVGLIYRRDAPAMISHFIAAFEREMHAVAQSAA
ncbi:LysR family transcriptional regulator [Undibacterium terreum]|uniref:Transcriptional regulator n=1 Tax=Undibacterium terreum TaxID=1224302 RepID=A0A916US77_9BURK|nr:LysR substrate-binding domain-containing protein [Undibacterium terreum]GGC84169.1 transcriptional regulator [Undibacterium terreum]